MNNILARASLCLGALSVAFLTGCDDAIQGILTTGNESTEVVLHIQPVGQDDTADPAGRFQLTFSPAESPKNILSELTAQITPDTLSRIAIQKFDFPRTPTVSYFNQNRDTEVHLPDGTVIYMPHRSPRTHKIRTFDLTLTDDLSLQVHVFSLRKCNSNNGKGRHHYYDYWSNAVYNYDVTIQFPAVDDLPQRTFQATGQKASKNIFKLLETLQALQ